MTKPYCKPALTLQEQLDKLSSRGLIVEDSAAAMQVLSSISYYRLSAYCYPFRQRDTKGEIIDVYLPDTSWTKIIELYEFDRRLRLLVLDATERIEISVRTQLTYHFGCTYGPFGHTDCANFHEKFIHQVWLKHIDEEVLRSSDKFIAHFKDKYEGFPTLPLWMLTEVMSLGNLSRLFRGLKSGDKQQIAAHFAVPHKRLSDWLHVLTYVRNVCAHHSRLWNRELAIEAKRVKDPKWSAPLTPRTDRIFYVLLVLKHLISATGNDADWTEQINRLLEPFAENGRWRAAMGIPSAWKTHPIWSI